MIDIKLGDKRPYGGLETERVCAQNVLHQIIRALQVPFHGFAITSYGGLYESALWYARKKQKAYLKNIEYEDNQKSA